MERLKRLGRGSKLIVAVCFGGAVFGIVSAVQAAIPDSNGVIHGCYQFSQTNNNGGALRVIDKDKNQICRKLEKPLDWNQRGPTGPTGASGTTGPSGVAAIFQVAGALPASIASGDTNPGVTPAWHFRGPTRSVGVTDTQSILANISGSLGHEIPPPAAPINQAPAAGTEFGFGVCYQSSGGGTIFNMNQVSSGSNANFARSQYSDVEDEYTGIGAVTPGAGTYNVGYCVDNYGNSTLNLNGGVNGYIEVVEGTVQ